MRFLWETKEVNGIAGVWGCLGTLLLFFLIVHLSEFWVPSRFTDLPTTNYNGKEVANQYRGNYQSISESVSSWHCTYWAVFP